MFRIRRFPKVSLGLVRGFDEHSLDEFEMDETFAHREFDGLNLEGSIGVLHLSIGG